MSLSAMTITARAGAVAFFLWGAIHVIGGVAILASAVRSPDAGYAFYLTSAPGHDALSGAILAYLAYALCCIGLAAMAIAARGNWQNGATALMANSVLVLATEIGLVAFILVPGHLGLASAAPGLVLAAIGVILGGVACRSGEHVHAA